MNILGKLLNVTGQVATVACGGAIMAAGGVIAGTGKLLTGNDNFGEGLKSVTKSAGSTVIQQRSKIGGGCETVVNKTFEIASEVGGATVGGTAKLFGANDDTVRKATIAGRMAAGMGIGLLAGDAISAGVTGLAALGTASTGTSIGLLSGAAANGATLAHIGGGALAAGGGGMAAGQAVLTAIDVGTAVDGAIGGATARKNQRENNK